MYSDCNHSWRCKPLLTVDKGGVFFLEARLQHCQKKTPQSNLVCVAHINKCFWGCKLDVQMCNHSDYWRCKPLLTVEKRGSLFSVARLHHCQKKIPQSNLVCVAHINKCFWGCKLQHIQMCKVSPVINWSLCKLTANCNRCPDVQPQWLLKV